MPTQKFTPKVIKDAQIWAPDYDTDFRKSSVKQYMKKNNLTKQQYIQEVKNEIKNNKRAIFNITNKDANREAQRRFREKNKQYNYIGNITVDFIYTKESKNTVYKFKKEENIPFQKKTTQKNLENDVRDAIENFKISVIMRYTDYKLPIIEAEVDDYKIHIKKEQDNDDLTEVRMKNAGACILDGYDKQEWDTNTGKCVFDYIISRYETFKGFISLCNYEDLHDIFSGGRTDINLLEVGVNTKEIKRFCQDRRIPMYALDDEEKVFDVYHPEKINNRVPAMVFRISNKHFYPITKTSKIQKVNHYNQVRSVLFDTVVEKPAYEMDIDLKNVVYCDDMMQNIKQHIADRKLPRNIVMNDNEIISYILDDKQYICNENIEINKEICENMNKKYTGQGLGTLLFDIVDETIKDIPKSTPNSEVYNKLVEAKKNRTHTGFLGNNNDTNDCIGVDIRKSYSYSTYNINEWIILDFNDKWEVYDYELKTGLYYVETNDYMLFKGNSIYSNKIIEKGLKESIEIDIKYQLIPKKTISNIFRTLIDKIVEYSKGNTNISKFLINMLTGMFGKSDCKNTKCYINNDLDQIFCFINDYKSKGVKVFVNKIEGTDYFFYGYKLEQQLNETNIPMYIQVVDDNNIRVYDMMKKLGGELVARKVDCCIVRNPNPIVESDEWGGYRYCTVPKIIGKEDINNMEMVIDTPYIEYYIKDSSKWKQIQSVLISKNGLLLQGDAGKGKTYCAKQIINYLDKDRVKVLAPTNKAALNIGGSTIHSFLKMTEKGYINPKLIKIIETKYDYIVIDEISMITKELWKRLCLLKRSCPHIKFLLLGDDKQIPPVEDENYGDYFNHPAVKYLCNNNKNTLQVLKRYDEELYNLLCNVDTIDISKYPNKMNKVNICYFNSTRKGVNAYWNNKEKVDGCLFIPENVYDEYSQDMYIYEGLPVICQKTKKGDDEIVCANSESFIVGNYDDENIYLWNERPDDNGEPVIYTMEIPINKFSEYFLLNYCSTIHRLQGTTITDDITIYDWENMNTKLRYTALSRVKAISQISFGKGMKVDVYHSFKKNIEKKIAGHLKYDKSKGYTTDIDCSYIMNMFKKQNGCCNKCNCEMKCNKYTVNDGKQFSIDRIDSNLGHIKGNIQLLCKSCNCSKHDRAY